MLLPGSLPPDRATLKALCDGLAALPEIASRLQSATVAEYSGSWSDAEREANGASGDLNDSLAVAHQINEVGDDAVTLAVATPLYAALGLTDLTPVDPTTISLSADESRALCEAADEHMREDGVRLHFIDAARWSVTCNRPIDILTERPEWIIGELLRPNLPRGRDARLVERWMNEMQMLLHSHVVNVAREERRLPPINLAWLWAFQSPARKLPSPQRRDAIHEEHRFAIAMRNGDLVGWQAAWQSVSAEILSAQTIILGDSRPRLRLTVSTPGMMDRLIASFRRKPTLAEVLTQLQQPR
ncbi:MAG: hypothetical protein ABIZ64_13050 [Casimicrobium sp.]